MRDYSKVSGQFWTGKTGRLLRGDMQAQIVALYLMTSHHANMIGVFNCPLIYIAHDTGSPFEGASKGLRRLVEAGFCLYEDESETVWVREMAKFQIGAELKSSDNRLKDVQKQYAAIPNGLIRQGFYEKYKVAYQLPDEPQATTTCKPLASPFEAPCKPLPSQEQEQEQKQEQEQEQEQDKTAASESPPPVAETEKLPIQNSRPAQQAIPGVDARSRKRAAGAADRFDAAQFLVEQGVESQTAADYLTLRKGKRAVATRTALQGIVREIAKSGMSMQAGIELCCNRGWAGFGADWDAVQQARDGPRQSRYDQCKATLDELTGRTKHDPKPERDITAEVFRIA